MDINEIFALAFIVLSFVAYVFRNQNTLCRGIWFVLQSFWIALFAVLLFGFIKGQFNKK